VILGGLTKHPNIKKVKFKNQKTEVKIWWF
jgi:hypothetical protein